MGGSLDEKELTFLFDNIPELKQLDIFIECGTYMGVSSRLVSRYFKDVYTFEINNKLFIDSIIKSLEEKLLNVHHYLGNSYDLIKLVILSDNRNSVFFLDAHQSGADSSNNGKELVPLLQELQIINTFYPKNTLGLIIVDDYRLWNTQPIPHDWAHITNEIILKSLNNHNIKQVFEMNDRMYIIIN